MDKKIAKATVSQDYESIRQNPNPPEGPEVWAGPIFFECEGLNESGPGQFVLHGVKMVQMDYTAIRETVEASGLSRIEADMLTEEFVTKIQTRLFAQALATRMQKVHF